MSSVSDLRVGDAERDAVADRLRESFAQGRLTMDEFNDRLSAALAATTQRDLSQLTRDLPHTSVPGPPLPQPQSVSSGQRTGLPYPGGQQQSGSRGGPRARSRLFPVMAALLALWLLASTVLTPLRMFPLGGRLAVFLVVFGVLRSIVRRVFGRR